MLKTGMRRTKRGSHALTCTVIYTNMHTSKYRTRTTRIQGDVYINAIVIVIVVI